jgi:hypothetical protein
LNVADVRFDIEHHTNAYAGKGALTTVEVDRLVRLAAVADVNAVTPDTYTAWAPSTAYTLNTKRVPTERTGFVYRVTTAGTAGAGEPSWPLVIGQTVTDGSVVWTADAVAPWLGAWNVYEAAAIGCEWRATKLADNFTVSLGTGKSFNRMETPKFWLDRAKQLRQRGGIGVITLRTSYASL